MAERHKMKWAPGLESAVLGLSLLVAMAGEVRAGTVVIGELHPFPQPSVTPGIRGITFDAGVDPLILDRWAWTLQRIDKSNASVLSSTTSNPVTSRNDQLVFDPTTGAYFTIGGATSLVRIEPITWDHATVGPLGTPQINF